MATQGIVSVIRDGGVIVKAIAGSDGDTAIELAQVIRDRKLDTAVAVADAAAVLGFGGEYTLVVMDAWGVVESRLRDDTLPPRYWQTFGIPDFNPRWVHGTAECVEIVDLGKDESEGPGVLAQVATRS